MIENLDKLTPEQLEKVKKQLLGINSNIEEQQAQPIADFFNKHGWVKIDEILNKETTKLFYLYCVLATERLNVLEQIEGVGNVDIGHYGRFNDPQAMGDYSKYGDLIFDTLLYALKDKMNLYTGIDLVPTYSYHRLYTTGTELTKHSDRPSCEISSTINIFGGEEWPIFIKGYTGEVSEVLLEPGYGIVYNGTDCPHWRLENPGDKVYQTFLHYVNADGPYRDHIFDKRLYLHTNNSLK